MKSTLSLNQTPLKRLASFFIVIILSQIFFNGIGRHDVPRKKYLQIAKLRQFDCVGQILINGERIGSCVLISPTQILTAAHVLIEADTRPDTMLFNNQKVIAYVPYNQRPADKKNVTVQFNENIYKIKTLVIHPTYLDSIATGICDIALIELTSPIQTIQAAILNAQNNELNAVATGIGFGVSGDAKKVDKVQLLNVKNGGQNTIDYIGGFIYKGKETILKADLDHPKNKKCNKMGDAKPLDLEYIVSGGDSGGGLFRQQKGVWELIGICVGEDIDIDQFNKTGYYGQTMNWTRVSAFKGWIDEYSK